MSYGNTGRPSDALGAVILAVPLAVYSFCVGGLYACDLIGSTVVDTLLLPLDAGVQQFDKDEQSDLTNSKASEVEAESKPKTPSK